MEIVHVTRKHPKISCGKVDETMPPIAFCLMTAHKTFIGHRYSAGDLIHSLESCMNIAINSMWIQQHDWWNLKNLSRFRDGNGRSPAVCVCWYEKSRDHKGNHTRHSRNINTASGSQTVWLTIDNSNPKSPDIQNHSSALLRGLPWHPSLQFFKACFTLPYPCRARSTNIGCSSHLDACATLEIR